MYDEISWIRDELNNLKAFLYDVYDIHEDIDVTDAKESIKNIEGYLSDIEKWQTRVDNSIHEIEVLVSKADRIINE